MIFKPHSVALEGLARVQNRLRLVANDQYYPSIETLHVTGLSLITCVNGFQLGDIDVERYSDVVEAALEDVPAFDLSFKGLTASTSCVMAQGFTDPKALSETRESIRINIDNAGLQHTIGQRYPPRTAHCTLLRFMVNSLSIDQLLQDLIDLRHANIGDCRINEAILVLNDWYHTPGIVQELRRVSLKS